MDGRQGRREITRKVNDEESKSIASSSLLEEPPIYIANQSRSRWSLTYVQMRRVLCPARWKQGPLYHNRRYQLV